MTRAIALARTIEATRIFEAVRAVVVCVCAVALIAAGQALPL